MPGTSYLYTLALFGMTFIGFAAIVMLLRQTLGRHLRAFDVLFARVYMEFAVIVSMGAMLPLLLMPAPLTVPPLKAPTLTVMPNSCGKLLRQQSSSTR